MKHFDTYIIHFKSARENSYYNVEFPLSPVFQERVMVRKSLPTPLCSGNVLLQRNALPHMTEIRHMYSYLRQGITQTFQIPTLCLISDELNYWVH